VSHARIRIIVTAALLAFALAGCGGGDIGGGGKRIVAPTVPGTPSNSAGMPNPTPTVPDRPLNSGDVPKPTLTVPDRPSDRVTDVAARALTEKQVQDLESKCTRHAGVPGTDKDCREVLQALVRLTPPCTPTSQVCILVGRVVGDSDVGVLQLRDQRSDSPLCGNGRIVLCKGITLRADVVAPLIDTLRTSTTTSETPSRSATAPQTSATISAPVPTITTPLPTIVTPSGP
jgi:hypothetical protein